MPKEMDIIITTFGKPLHKLVRETDLAAALRISRQRSDETLGVIVHSKRNPRKARVIEALDVYLVYDDYRRIVEMSGGEDL